MSLFPGFAHKTVPTTGGEIYLVHKGDGPPVLLLHGYPQTHACWHKVAPALAERFTVVCPDLKGYGDSSKPAGDKDHANYSKRTLAAEQIEVMAALGYERFAIVGHDRGARVGYRLSLDHPERVTRLAVLDIIPTIETFERMDRRASMATYHWYFLAQPPDLPERLIGADPEFFLRHTLKSWCGDESAFVPEALEEYRRCFHDPRTIHSTCEDYRAGATIDCDIDAADRGRRQITCPLLALWGEGKVHRRPWDPLVVWQQWAVDVCGRALPCGHFLPEEAPAETTAELIAFLAH
jgi:haloacetate dehalogenase